MKDKWQENKSAELQQYADEFKIFFAGMKAVYGPSPNTMVPVWSADGTLLTEKSDIVQHWNEHQSVAQRTHTDRPKGHPGYSSVQVT